MSERERATKYRWDDLEVDHPMELVSRRRIVGERVMLARVHLAKGFHLDSHAHENEQIAVVLEGRIRFRLAEGTPDEEDVVVVGGEALHFPANVSHGADALEDSLVLDIFSPVSEETGIDAGR